MKELAEEEIFDIQCGIDNEGFDYYFNEGGWGVDKLKGTELEEPMNNYIKARRDFIEAMNDAGINY